MPEQEVKISPDLIREAASKCSTAAATLKILFPDVFKTNDPTEKFNKEQDIYNHLGVNPDKDVIQVDGFDKEQTEWLRKVIRKVRFCEAYNGKKKLSISERRYFNYYYNKPGAGLVFNHSSCTDDSADLGSAARLSMGKQEHLDDARKKFPDLDLDIIDLR